MKALIDDARTFHSRPRLAMLVVPSLSFFIAIFIVYPLASQVVIQLVCDNMYRDDAESKDCSSVEVSRQAALVTLYCELAINIPAFFSSGLYGKACDKYGRRLVMLISLYGFMGYLVCLLSITYFEALSGSFLYFLLAGYFFFGVLGSNTAFQMAAFLYAADITEGKPFAERSHVYSVLEACLFLAKVLGPLCAGIWAKETSFLQPLLCGMGFVLISICWTTFVLRDSVSGAVLEKNRNGTLSIDFMQSVNNIKYVMTIQPVSGQGRSPVPFLFVSFFVYYITYMAEGVLTIFYVKCEFGWDSDVIGYYMSLGSSLQILSMTLVPYLFVRAYGKDVSDIYWILTGYSARCVFYMLLPQYRNPRLLFANTALLLLTGPPTPRSRAAIINSVRYQSKAMSAFAAVQALGLLCSPIFNAVYSATVYSDPEFIYYVFAALCATAAALSIYIVVNSDLRQNLPGHSLSPRTLSVAKNSYSVDHSAGASTTMHKTFHDPNPNQLFLEEPLLSSLGRHESDSTKGLYEGLRNVSSADNLRDSVVTITGSEGGDGGGVYDGAAPQEMYDHLR